jgi:hypothetical protein
MQDPPKKSVNKFGLSGLYNSLWRRKYFLKPFILNFSGGLYLKPEPGVVENSLTKFSGYSAIDFINPARSGRYT